MENSTETHILPDHYNYYDFNYNEDENKTFFTKKNIKITLITIFVTILNIISIAAITVVQYTYENATVPIYLEVLRNIGFLVLISTLTTSLVFIYRKYSSSFHKYKRAVVIIIILVLIYFACLIYIFIYQYYLKQIENNAAKMCFNYSVVYVGFISIMTFFIVSALVYN